MSWANNVFPLLEGTGPGACGKAGCHAAGGQLPTVVDSNAGTTYANFKAYTGIAPNAYIVPGDTNAADQTMDCNLVTGTCGAAAMPIAPTGSLSAAQKMTIDTWIKCGSPQN